MHAYERHAYEMVYGRCAPIWDARLWDAYPVRCTPTRCTPMRCPFMGDARLWEGHAYEMAVYGRDARL